MIFQPPPGTSHFWRRHALSGGPRINASETFSIAQMPDLRTHGLSQPRLIGDGVLRIDRQPLREQFAALGGGLRQLQQFRPRGFWIDVVGSHGRHAAPVVDARPDQTRQIPGAEIRRSLKVHFRAENDPRHRNRPDQFLQARLRGVRHFRVRLRPEVLDDDFLKVSVPLVQFSQRQQRFDALPAGFADADEDAGGEGDFGDPRLPDRFETSFGVLVRRAVVRPSFFTQPPGRTFQHQALRNRNLPQCPQILGGHHSGVEMRQ